MILEKVISGGQTGVDRGALYAARDLGVPIGGWMPRGARAEDGRVPAELAAQLREMPSASYPARTRHNVEVADGTMILSFAQTLTGGSLQTQKIADAEPLRFGQPAWIHLTMSEAWLPLGTAQVQRAVGWILVRKILVLNVAGPRESKEPGVERAARRAVGQVLHAVALAGQTRSKG